MHAGRRFTIKDTLFWTLQETIIFAVVSTLAVFAYHILDWKWIAIPWLPIALVGTAVAFVTGFKNNASYDRLWEARKIWGAIVNSSRSLGIMVLDYVNNDHAHEKRSPKELKVIHQQMLYRHMAWLTALRFQLRASKKWELMSYHKASQNFRKKYLKIDEFENSLEDSLKPYLSEDERQYVLSKKNRATHIIRLQSKDLKKLKEEGLIEDFRHMEMENMLVDFYTQQGKSERIKNFPYPRQYTTINTFFVWIFIFFLPLGMLREFENLGTNMVWLTVPFTMVAAWVFHTIDKIGTSSENPFEGAASDTPITALSRTIEIDLREMLDEANLPEPLEAKNNFLM